MLIGLLTHPAVQLLARAGGGQRGGGGGGGSGGSGGGSFYGGGGGGGGGTFFLLELLLLGHGLGFLGLLVLGVIAFLVFRAVSGAARARLGGAGAGYADAPPAGAPPPPGYPPAPVTAPLPGRPVDAMSAAAYGAGAAAGTAGSAPAAAAGYDDTHPIGVPERLRGATLAGSAPAVLSSATMPAEDGVAAIRAHDPGFDPEAFLGQAQSSFFIIQQAWSQTTPEASRSVMADGLAQQFAFQMEEYRRSGRRNMLDGLNVQAATVVGAHSDSTWDTVAVRFDAASADYDMDAKGHVVSGHRDVQPWSEEWIFQRSAQATTKPGQGTMNRKCPNCQAPIAISAEGVCEYCHAQVMSGKYDWVLTRIEQLG